MWIYNKLTKHGGFLTLLNMADERFFPVNVAYTIYIQRNIKKQRKEKKNHSKVRVFTLTAAKINSL